MTSVKYIQLIYLNISINIYQADAYYGICFLYYAGDYIGKVSPNQRIRYTMGRSLRWCLFFSLGKMLPELCDLGKLTHNWHKYLRDIDCVMYMLLCYYLFLGNEDYLWIISLDYHHVFIDTKSTSGQVPRALASSKNQIFQVAFPIVNCEWNMLDQSRPVWFSTADTVTSQNIYSLKREHLVDIGTPIINMRRSSDGLKFIVGFLFP